MKNFAIIGAAGYVAPRHMKAIRETGNRLVAALDPHDSVGVIDSYFPEASFFTEIERFDRYLEKMKREGHKIDYLSVCSPNYLHDAHIRFGLRYGADVICEKPIVLNHWNVDALEEIEKEYERNVYSIMQLRLHPSIKALKEKVDNSSKETKHKIRLTYQTSRGKWYYASWKGDENKSGGVATNIGVHFFDMLIWLFGDVKENIVHAHSHDRAAGFLKFENAEAEWFLSINSDTISQKILDEGLTRNRSLLFNGEEVDFTDGFEDLHTESYKEILKGDGIRVDQMYNTIKLLHEIRHSEPQKLMRNYHPLAELPQSIHPFKS